MPLGEAAIFCQDEGTFSVAEAINFTSVCIDAKFEICHKGIPPP
jgi:hypothetical protein